MRSGLVIGLDVDGVLADLHAPWLRWANRRFGTDFSSFPDWDAPTRWWGSAAFDFFTADLYERIWPIRGAIETVTLLRAMGHSLRFVTHCLRQTEPGKKQWLLGHGFLHGDTEFVATSDKSRVPVDILVDDAIHNVWAFKGGPSVLVDAPHNQRFRHDIRIPHISALPGVLYLP